MSRALVLDIGSDTIKAGFAGDSQPCAEVSASVEWDATPKRRLGRSQRNKVSTPDGCGWRRKETVKIQRGVLQDGSGLRQVLQKTFKAVNADPGAQPVLLTVAPLHPLANRCLLLQSLFEEFEVPGVYAQLPAALSLTSQGSHTGLVVDSGHGISYALPLIEGFVPPHAVQRLDFGGADVTAYLGRLLSEERGFSPLSGSGGGSCSSSSGSRRRFAALRQFKEEHSYVALDFKEELNRARSDSLGFERSMELPDGTLLAAGSERFRCAEALFQPLLAGIEAQGLHQMTHGAFKKCEVDLQRGLARNVVLTGGTMQLPGMEERMRQELQTVLPLSLQVKVSRHPLPLYSAFAGGSITASMSDMVEKWTTREDYLECGLAALERCCPWSLHAHELARRVAPRAGG